MIINIKDKWGLNFYAVLIHQKLYVILRMLSINPDRNEKYFIYGIDVLSFGRFC